MTTLHEAARQGNVAALQQLLDQGATVDERDAEGFTSLALAVFAGHKDAVALLIDRGADLASKDPHGYAPAERAAYEGYLDVLQLLVDRSAPLDKENILHDAAHYAGERDKARVVEYLIGTGIDVNGKDSDGETPLHRAAIANYAETIKLLLVHGADAGAVENLHGSTPLHLAAMNTSKGAVEALIHGGANVNAVDRYGFTPLHYAVQNKAREIVDLLVAHGATADSAVSREMSKRSNGHPGQSPPPTR